MCREDVVYTQDPVTTADKVRHKTDPDQINVHASPSIAQVFTLRLAKGGLNGGK